MLSEARLSPELAGFEPMVGQFELCVGLIVPQNGLFEPPLDQFCKIDTDRESPKCSETERDNARISDPHESCAQFPSREKTSSYKPHFSRLNLE